MNETLKKFNKIKADAERQRGRPKWEDVIFLLTLLKSGILMEEE